MRDHDVAHDLSGRGSAIAVLVRALALGRPLCRAGDGHRVPAAVSEHQRTVRSYSRYVLDDHSQLFCHDPDVALQSPRVHWYRCASAPAAPPDTSVQMSWTDVSGGAPSCSV